MNILSIESDLNFANYLAEIFADDDINFSNVPSLSEGIPVLNTGKVDVLLIEFCPNCPNPASMLGALLGYGIPIIVISGNNDLELAQKLCLSGAKDYIVKPPTRGHLVLKVKLLHSHNVQRRSIPNWEEIKKYLPLNCCLQS
jgi:DNA-binding response OmpR family regulator